MENQGIRKKKNLDTNEKKAFRWCKEVKRQSRENVKNNTLAQYKKG